MKRRRLGKLIGRSSGYFTLKCFLEEEHKQAQSENRVYSLYIHSVGIACTDTPSFPNAGLITLMSLWVSLTCIWETGEEREHDPP